MAITYQPEKFTAAFYDEVLPLFEAHYDEISEDKDVIGPLDVMHERYIHLAEIGALEVMVARGDKPSGEHPIIGYIIALVDHSLHYRPLLRARVDIYYVDPAWRQFGLGQSIGAQLFRAFEKRMRQRDVKIIYTAYKEAHPHGKFFNSLGYRPFERSVCKVLK